MELILDSITYKDIDDISCTFYEKVNFLCGIDASLLKDMLFQNVSLSKGYVMVNIRASKKDVYLVSLREEFNKGSILEEANYLNEYYSLDYNDVPDRIGKSLVMVGLNNYGDRYFSDLSTSELKKVKLAFALYLNSKIIILDNIEKGLCSKDINYLNQLLYKINRDYNKNIIICSNDLDKYLNIVDRVIICNNCKLVVDVNSDDLYNDDIYKYIKMPNIIHFIKYLDNTGHKFDKYNELKELLKAIYRDVENK